MSLKFNVMFLLPNDKTGNFIVVWCVRRNPRNLHAVRSNLTKVQISGGRYSYLRGRLDQNTSNRYKHLVLPQKR